MSEVLPVDQHVLYHKLVGVLLVLLGTLHSIMHLINIGNVAWFNNGGH